MFFTQLFVLQPDPWKSHYCWFPVKTCNEDETVDAIQDVKIKTHSALNVVKTKLTSHVFHPSIQIFFFLGGGLCLSVGWFKSNTLCFNRHSIDSSVTLIICVCAGLLIHVNAVGTIITLVHPKDNKGTAEWCDCYIKSDLACAWEMGVSRQRHVFPDSWSNSDLGGLWLSSFAHAHHLFTYLGCVGNF